MNAVHLTGRLTRDPEMRATASGGDVCGIRLAVDGPRDADTTFIDVTAFDKLAGTCAEYLTQGRPIAVSGRLSYGVLRSFSWKSLQWRGDGELAAAEVDEGDQGCGSVEAEGAV